MKKNEIKILIIDEEKAIRRSLTFFLEDSGFFVKSAENLESAFSLNNTFNFDLAVVDLNLKNENGEDFIIKANSINPDMKFIIYTGDQSYIIPEYLSKIGLSKKNVLIKPVFEISVFLEVINNIINGGT